MLCNIKNNVYMEDMKRAVINPGFFIGILGLTVMLMRTVWYFKDMPGQIPVMEICSYPMALSGFTVFSAAFPAWGYANQFYKEEKTGYIRFILSRMSWKKYMCMRMTSVCISGGLVIAVPLAILFMFAYLTGSGEVGDLFQGMQVRETIIHLGIPAVLLMKTGLGALFGIFWALIGLFSSLLIRNKYAPFIIPFILNQFFWIVFANDLKLNLVFLVRGEDLDSYGLSAVLLLVYCILAAGMTFFVMRRRMRE